MMESTNYRFLVPDFYTEFSCKCGDCRRSCCEGWDVAISQKEYFDLLSVRSSDELNSRISRAFYIPKDATPDRYAMLNHDWLGNCPLRSHDGLCMLHAEAGEEYLPEVCRMYPRGLRKDLSEASLSNSCEKVLEMLIERKTPLRFVEEDINASGAGYEVPSRMSLRMQCIGILQDRNSTMTESFESVGFLISGKRAAKRPFEECLSVMLDFCELYAENESSLQRYCENSIRYLTGISENEYLKRRSILSKKFPDIEAIQENIMVNHLFVSKFPYSETRENETEEYESLCAMLCFICVLVLGNIMGIDSEQDLVDLLASTFRVAEHSAFHYNAHVLLDRAGFGEPETAGSLLNYSL